MSVPIQAIGIAGRYLTKVAVGSTTVKVKTDGRPPVQLGGTVHIAVPRDRVMPVADVPSHCLREDPCVTTSR